MDNAANEAYFRFYEELNDFLPRDRKKVRFKFQFNNNPSIKDAIESLGVPHTEIDLILINEESVDFSYLLKDGDYVAIYPMFESVDIKSVTRLRELPLRNPKFVLDVHLGKLAKYLRLLGFNIVYAIDFQDSEIIDISIQEVRCILTRDIGLLKNKKVVRGYWVRSTDPVDQTREILQRFDLYSLIRAFTRCLKCNDVLVEIDKAELMDRLEPRTKRDYQDFLTCPECHRIYWRGSHYERMKKFISRVLQVLHPK